MKDFEGLLSGTLAEWWGQSAQVDYQAGGSEFIFGECGAPF